MTTITISREELIILNNILGDFSDYVARDDRIDHGWNKLKEWREINQEMKNQLYSLTGKLKRRLRKTSL